MEVDLETAELLAALQQRLNALHVLRNPSPSNEYQYALELQALIYGRQGKDDEAQRCIDQAVAQAGSNEGLYSRMLKNYVRTHPANVVPAVKLEIASSAGKLSALSARDQKFMHKYRLEDAPDITFFVRKPVIMTLLILVTGGTYVLYWMYRNWRTIGDKTVRNISPFWRTFFSIFYLWPLFRIIGVHAKLRGYKKFYSGGLFTICYFIPGITVSMTLNTHSYILQLPFSWLISFVVAITILWIVHAAASYNNSHLTVPVRAFSPRGRYEVLVAAIGTVYILSSLLFVLAHPALYTTSPWKRISQQHAALGKLNKRSQQFQACATDLQNRHDKVDRNNKAEKDAYNADVTKCIHIYEQRQQALKEYESLRGY